jgi:hypothetical protein
LAVRENCQPFISKKNNMIEILYRHRLLNHLGVFVTRSRHKCSIGLNRLQVIWSFNKE